MFGLYPSSEKTLLKILGSHDAVDEAVIYGSRAKGNNREGSDIDIVVKGSLSNDELYTIKNEIEESTIPYLIDISIYSKIESEALIEHIDRVGKIFYTRLG